MKKAAIISLFLVLLVGGTLVFALVGTRLDATAHTPQVYSAADHEAEFQRLKKALHNNSLIGTAYAPEIEGESSDYNLVIYTVTLSNKGLLPASMAELIVSPAQTDILCYTDGSALGEIPDISVPSGGSATIRCVLLTRAQARQSTVRDLYISYYIWGNPFTIRITAAS